MKLKDLVKYINDLLAVKEISDSSQNGLQVEKNGSVSRIGIAVDASLATFKKAKKRKVDFLIVHHGLFWSKPVEITGLYYKRISYLIKNDIALYGAHLPLDLHSELGNNAQIAKALHLLNVEPFGEYHGVPIGVMGKIAKSEKASEYVKMLENRFKVEFDKYLFGKKRIRKIGIVSGGGDSLVEDAVKSGLDLFISGELGHSTYHVMKEYKINCVFGGHYFTETFGVKALGNHLKEKFGIPVVFLDVPTGL